MKASTSLVAAAGAATRWRRSVLTRGWRPEAKLAAGNKGGDGGGTSSISGTETNLLQIATVGGGSLLAYTKKTVLSDLGNLKFNCMVSVHVRDARLVGIGLPQKDSKLLFIVNVIFK